MKAVIAFLAANLFLAGDAQARQDYIIKQRARELSNQNNVRQGVPPPVEQPHPAAAPAANPQQQQALSHIKADLAAIQANSQVTAQQKQKLAADIIAAASGAAKPTQATAAKVAEDLAAACSEKPLSDSSRFLRDLDAVLNPAKYPQAKWDGIFADVQAVFQENGAARKSSVQISEDVKVLAAEVKR